MHLVIGRAEAWASDADAGIGVRPEELVVLPAHADDMNWSGALEALFADHDILLLFGPEQDGIEDPATWENKSARIGDYRTPAWFDTFAFGSTRNPDRGFRR